MSPTQSYGGDFEPTQIYVSTQQSYAVTLSYAGGYQHSGSWLYKKKDETAKEKLLRQRLAFKMFFLKPIFIAIDENKFTEPMNLERCNRIDKFKPKALNLIQKNIN